MNKTLYILCGPPGSGKSTWVKEKVHNDDAIIISRDIIRFYMMEDNDYFANEKEVFKEYVKELNIALALPYGKKVYADATHLTEKSRNKLLNKLSLNDVDIICVNFNTSLDTCLDRNESRKGLEYISRSVIRRLHESFQPATFDEKYKYKMIIEVS